MRCLDLFAGCGGASLGLHRAGLHHVALIERDPLAAEAARRAASRDDVGWSALDVLELDVANIRWTPPAEVWWASPPCQPFSPAGKRKGGADERDGYPLLLDLLDRTPNPPVWLLVENVNARHLKASGCRRGADPRPDACSACHQQACERALLGRFEWGTVVVVDAADYGVPQHRRRRLLVAGPREVVLPRPTHCDPDLLGGGPDLALFRTALLPWVTIRDVIALGEGEVAVGGGTEPSRTVGSKGNAQVLLDRPAPRASDALYRSTGRRRFTVEECAILQGLPPDWPFQGTKRARYRQVGNAVPPRLAEVFARAVVEAHVTIPSVSPSAARQRSAEVGSEPASPHSAR